MSVSHEGSDVHSILTDYWHIILAAASGIAGYVNLSAKADKNEQDIKELAERWNAQRREDQEEMKVMLKEIKEDQRETRIDIKELLKRG